MVWRGSVMKVFGFSVAKAVKFGVKAAPFSRHYVGQGTQAENHAIRGRKQGGLCISPDVDDACDRFTFEHGLLALNSVGGNKQATYRGQQSLLDTLPSFV